MSRPFWILLVAALLWTCERGPMGDLDVDIVKNTIIKDPALLADAVSSMQATKSIFDICLKFKAGSKVPSMKYFDKFQGSNANAADADFLRHIAAVNE